MIKVQNNDYESVTTFIQNEYEPDISTQMIFVSKNIVKENIKNKSGITNEKDLQDYWNILGNRKKYIGSCVHEYIKLFRICKQHNMAYPEIVNSYEQAAINVFEKLYNEYEIYRMESSITNDLYKLKGIPDIIMKHRINGELIMIDWKTGKDINVERRNKLKGNLTDIKYSKLVMAIIQLIVYNIIGDYKIDINNLKVVELREDSTYMIYTINDINTNGINMYDMIKQTLDNKIQGYDKIVKLLNQ